MTASATDRGTAPLDQTAAPPVARPGQHEIESLVLLFGQRRYAEAERQARTLTARFPQDGFGWKALGAVLKQLGRTPEAIVPLRRAAEFMAEDAESHYNLGNALLELGLLTEAEACYRRTLALNQHYLPAYYNLGNVQQAAGRLSEAESSYRTALRFHPDFTEALSSLGVVLKAQDRTAEAEACFRQVLRADARDVQAALNLANLLHAAGNITEAESTVRTGLAHAAGSADLHSYLALLLASQGRVAEAEGHYRQAVTLEPGMAQAHNGLGVVLRQLERESERVSEGVDSDRMQQAEASHRRALALKPDFAEAHNDLGNALREQGRYHEAQDSYRAALRLQPAYAMAHYNLGNVYKDQSLFVEAEACYREALRLAPAYVEAHNNLGSALKEQSRLQEAQAAYEAALALKPDFIEAHYALSALKTYARDDAQLGMLERMVQGIPAMPVEAQIRYWFTIGKVREDVGDYDAAFAAYREGNRLQHASLRWDDAAEEALHQRVTTAFTREFFAARVNSQVSQVPAPAANRTPIFIVGMPRSGTSLLEQILSSVPGVHGAGEMSHLSEVLVEAMPQGDYAHFPDAIVKMSDEELQHLGRQYVERLWREAPDATHITDKMPANFFYAGLIPLMLPQAKIIHAMRDPMDSCFSCYSRLFAEQNLGFTYDLGTLGRYYARYIRLMRHWHAVLPPGSILDMPYESMVAETETQARRLLEYLELPWDERCLAFHENKRRVKTASVAQVRKPIYKTSLARWQRYEAHLAELFALVRAYRD